MRRPPLPGLFGALAAGSGLLLAAAAPPAGLAPLAWVGLAPLFVAVLRGTHPAAYGLAFGAVYFGAHLNWIFLFGWMAWTALTLALAAYTAAATLLAKRLRSPALMAGAWVALEMLHGSWPWGGFAWGAVGTTQAPVPGVRWLAGAIGAYGLSFLCAFASATVAFVVVDRRLPRRDLAAVACVTLGFAGVDALAFRRTDDGRQATITVVQGDVPRPAGLDQEERVLENHARLTRRVEGAPDVVIWPESAAGFLPDEVVDPVVAEAARRLGTTLLVGRTRPDEPGGTFDNAVEQVSPDGEVVARYSKRHAVPFGERVPLPVLRRFVSTLQQVPLDMRPGREVVVFDAGGIRIGTPICFEVVFPRDVRDFVRAGAEVIVVSTNDASFERSAASEQQLAHSRMRALESRRWVVQAAISGVSAVVAPDGSVSGRTRLFTKAIVTAHVRARRGSTLWIAVGDLYSWIWTIAAAAALAWRRARVGRPVA